MVKFKVTKEGTMLNLALSQLKQFIYASSRQQQCLLCHQSSATLICHFCRNDLNLFDLKTCHYNLLNRQNIYSYLEPPRYQKLLALAPYQQPLSRLISQLKFGHQLINAKALADLFYWHCLSESNAPQIGKNNVVIPMPLHSSRLRSRKYNQSLEIVRHLNIDKKVWHDELCQRTINTKAQTELSAKQRRHNVKGAFKVIRPINKNHVIIFDDVVTTGATVNSLCKTLLAANPNLTIEIWCIGLTLGYNAR
jgi:ComF family protein